MRGEIDEQLVKLDNWLSLWNVQDISRIYPVKVSKPMYPSHTNSRDKESLNFSTQAKPSQAKLEEQLEEQHRQGAALPSDYITRPIALVQHCIVAEEQHRGAAGSSSSREAEEHLSGMCIA